MATQLSSNSGVSGMVGLITGGRGSIGGAVVRALVRDGATISSADLGEPADPKDDGAHQLELDVTDLEQVCAAVDAIVGRDGRIDIAVGAAGIAGNTPLVDLTSSEIQQVLQVNLVGFLNLLRAVVPHMQRQQFGKIVALGSVAARIGGVKSGIHYVSAKSAVHGAVKWAAKTYGPDGIFVNVVAPGPVLTPMWDGLNDGVRVEDAPGYPLGRLGRPEDIAEPIVFLCGTASNWITGATLDINGGMYLS